jgi:hypothetical protein
LLEDQRKHRDTKKKLIVGFRTWAKGYTNSKGNLEETKKAFRSLDDEHEEIVEGPDFFTVNPDGSMVQAELIKKNTLPNYWDQTLWNFIELGINVEKHGFPFDVGWAELPCHLWDMMQLYESEINEARKKSAR